MLFRSDRSGPAKNVATKKKTTEQLCPECGGAMWPETMINEKKDACYYKVKSRYKVWPSAYASGALVRCRKKGAKNWGNKSESVEDQLDEKWSTKYKRSINCNNPKGFSQRAHCQGRKKHNEDAEQSVEEGWKSALAGAALAGSMALGSAGPARAADLSAMSTSYLQQVASGQHARPLVSVDDAKQELQQREQGKSQAVPATKPSSARTGYSQSYLQSVVDGTHSRPMISVEKARELLQQQYGVNENQGVAEGSYKTYQPKHVAWVVRHGDGKVSEFKPHEDDAAKAKYDQVKGNRGASIYAIDQHSQSIPMGSLRALRKKQKMKEEVEIGRAHV